MKITSTDVMTDPDWLQRVVMLLVERLGGEATVSLIAMQSVHGKRLAFKSEDDGDTLTLLAVPENKQ